MISFISGQIIKKAEKTLIIKTASGIGYSVFIPTSILAEIKEEKDIELFTHFHVREDKHTLYGFQNYNDLKFFELLISVSGIGPKVGVEIISASPETIKSAIFNQDVKTLVRIPGLGKKTAERLILELKNKIEILPENLEDNTINNDINNDTIEALITLGYQRFHIHKILKSAPPKITETEEIIRYFLTNC